MNGFKISDITNGKKYDSSIDLEKDIKAKMQELDDIGDEWYIDIDNDISEIRFWTFFLNNNNQDFKNLAEIRTSNSTEYHSENGCLLNKENNLVFAPKCKRLYLPLGKMESVDRFYASVWNIVCSLPIRTIFENFLLDKSLRNYFENVLLLYRKNILECCFRDLLRDVKVRTDDIIKEIRISDEIIRKKYDSIEFRENIERLPTWLVRQDGEENSIQKFKGFETVLYGQYFVNEKKIVLYPEAMKTSGKIGKDLCDIFISTFIHEFFHAIHENNIIDDAEYRHHDEENQIIRESLADAIEYNFIKCTLENDALAKEKYNGWKRHSVLVYPYSGALALVDASTDRLKKNIMHFFMCYIRIANSALKHEINDISHGRIEDIAYIKYLFIFSLKSIPASERLLLTKYFEKYI